MALNSKVITSPATRGIAQKHSPNSSKGDDEFKKGKETRSAEGIRYIVSSSAITGAEFSVIFGAYPGQPLPDLTPHPSSESSATLGTARQRMQTIYFTLRFDPLSEERIRSLQRAIAAQAVPVRGLTRHRPHITLAAYDVGDLDAMCDSLDEFASTVTTFPLGFRALGIFPEEGVLYLAPPMSERLFTLQRLLIAAFATAGYPALKHDRLAPDVWMPRCTLAVDLNEETMSKALAVCRRRWSPITGTAEAIGVLAPPEMQDFHEAVLIGAPVARTHPHGRSKLSDYQS